MPKARPNSNTQATQEPVPTSISETVIVGIDWADKEHAFSARHPNGKIKAGSFKQNKAGIDEWINEIGKFALGCNIDVCIETSSGALINALMEYPQVRIFPVNPLAVANYRKAFAPGGGKNDPIDARLIMQFLQHYRDQLRKLAPNSPETRELSSLVLDRRQFVEQRVALANRMTAFLKSYFPTILELKPARSYSEFVIRLVHAYPTLEEAQMAGKVKLRKILFGTGEKRKTEARLDTIMQAKPLTTDPVLLRTNARRCRSLAAQIDVLNESIKSYDAEIKTLVRKHADYEIVKNLPGASDKTHARLIAALGDDRSRYANAESLQAAAGIAPITTRSGNSWYVSARWSSSKFIRQTFHEYAGLSIVKCSWAKAYYELQLTKGKTPQMAKRALAFKWIRIIFRLWQARIGYDDSHYVSQLNKTGSPLAKKLQSVAS